MVRILHTVFPDSQGHTCFILMYSSHFLLSSMEYIVMVVKVVVVSFVLLLILVAELLVYINLDVFPQPCSDPDA